MTVTTPLYGLVKFATKEPAAMTAAIVNATVDRIEAVLQGAGITPPSADLTAMLAQLSAFNTRDTAGEFTDSGWQNVTVAGGFAATTQAPQVRKVGKLVIARGGWSSTGLSASSTATVGTVPAGYRPAVGIEVAPGLSASGTSSARLAIATGGGVAIQTSGTVAGYFRIDGVTWMVD